MARAQEIAAEAVLHTAQLNLVWSEVLPHQGVVQMRILGLAGK
jgi:hypothetical protein